MIEHFSRLGRSINDRLAGQPGEDVPALGTGYVSDILRLARQQQEALERMELEAQLDAQ